VADSAVKQAKDMLFSDTSVDFYLSRLFDNYGVPRPIANPSDDDMYRRIGQLMATQPKTRGVRVTYQLLEILFGTQASLIAANRRAWQIFETKPNVLTVEVPQDLIVGMPPTNASYLRGLGGSDGTTGAGPTNQFLVYRQEDFTTASTPMVGLTLYINNVAHTITGITYDATQGLNTFTTLDNVAANLTDAKWYVTIPAADTYPGGYMLKDATHSSAEIGGNEAILFGPGLVDIFVQYMTQIAKAAGVVLDIQLVAPGYVRPNPTPPVTLVSITIAPVNPTIAHTTTQQFIATGHYSNGSTADLTSQCNWLSSDTTKATVGNGGAFPPIVIPNNDFETGDFTDWLLTNNGQVTSSFSGVTPHGGNFMGVVGLNTPLISGSRNDVVDRTGHLISLPNPPEAGVTYTLSFWYALVKFDLGTPVNTQNIQLFDQSGSFLAQLVLELGAINQPFTQFTIDVTAYAGVTNLNLRFTSFVNQPGTWCAICIDDVQVLRTPSTNAKGLARGIAAGQTIITAKFPNGPAGTTLLTLT